MAMRYRVNNNIFQSVSVELGQEESVYAESGKLLSMSPNISMDTGVKGGLFKGLKRSISGESMFLVSFSCEQGSGYVSFAAELPGQILPVELAQSQTRVCQQDAFLAAEEGVDLDIERVKMGAALFGGEGFFLQKLTGPGTAFVNIGGEIETIELERNQRIKADVGSVAMFEDSVDYDVERIKGVKNMVFGGETMFLASLTGPGKVWLQTMNVTDLRAKLSVGKK